MCKRTFQKVEDLTQRKHTTSICERREWLVSEGSSRAAELARGRGEWGWLIRALA